MASACAQGFSAEEQPAGDDPCKVLTRREILAHLNVPPSSPTLFGPPAPTSVGDFTAGSPPPPIGGLAGLKWCIFRADPPAPFPTYVWTGLISESKSKFARQTLDKWSRDARERGVALRPIRNLGTRAVWEPGALFVLDDDELLVVVIKEAPSPSDERPPAELEQEKLTRAKQLANLALRRI